MSNKQQTTESPPFDEEGLGVKQPEPAPPALHLLAQLRGGSVMDQLGIEINRVVNGVKDSKTGKGGEIVMKIKITPMKRGPHNGVEVTAAVLGKALEDPPTYDIFFYDDDGSLHTRNPRQKDIFEDGPKQV